MIARPQPEVLVWDVLWDDARSWKEATLLAEAAYPGCELVMVETVGRAKTWKRLTAERRSTPA